MLSINFVARAPCKSACTFAVQLIPSENFIRASGCASGTPEAPRSSVISVINNLAKRPGEEKERERGSGDEREKEKEM